jgi:hypothetical protein
MKPLGILLIPILMGLMFSVLVSEEAAASFQCDDGRHYCECLPEGGIDENPFCNELLSKIGTKLSVYNTTILLISVIIIVSFKYFYKYPNAYRNIKDKQFNKIISPSRWGFVPKFILSGICVLIIFQIVFVVGGMAVYMFPDKYDFLTVINTAFIIGILLNLFIMGVTVIIWKSIYNAFKNII